MYMYLKLSFMLKSLGTITQYLCTYDTLPYLCICLHESVTLYSTMNKISYITKIRSTCIFALLLLSYKNALNIKSTLQSDPLIPKVRNCLLLWHWTIYNIRNTKFMKINKLYPTPWTYKSLNTFKTLYMHDFEFVLC